MTRHLAKSLLAALMLAPAIAYCCIVPPASCRVSSPFGPRIDPVKKTVGQFHKGVDFACPAMTPVVAGQDGAAEPGWDNGGGNVVRIYTTDGNTLWYMHNTMYKVSNGQFVKAGTVISLSGNTGGHTTGAHVHLQFGTGRKDVSKLQDPYPRLCSAGSGGPANPLDSPGEISTPSSEMKGSSPSEAQLTYPTEGDSESVYAQLLALVGSRVYNPGYAHDLSTLSAPKLYAEYAYLKTVHLRARQEIRLSRDRTEAMRALALALQTEQALKRKMSAAKNEASGTAR